jgi:outer membrane protein OmpA-like peptidoglycan-associated protein
MKRLPGFRCAQRQIACAEVELVHAGHEFNQQQWRHAKPYVQIAEDQIAQAQTLIEQCEPPAPPPRVAPVAVTPAPPPPPAPVAPPSPVRSVELLVNVVFDFDRSGANNIRPFSVVQLDDLLARVKRDGLQITGIRLIGHADRLNGTGHGEYNQQLSEKRVATVREVLLGKGVDGALVNTEARGDSQPVNGCEGSFKSRRELEECLLPNRRVELRIDARMR